MISAIVLAAGMSKRMGLPKMVLPWGNSTVLGQVISTLLKSELHEVIVVTGGAHKEVYSAIKEFPVEVVFNPEYEVGDMLSSIKTGLDKVSDLAAAVLITLGDQPQIQIEVLQAVIEKYRSSRSDIVIPSYQMRRGHPWLLGRSKWELVLSLSPLDSLRSFLSENDESITYVEVDTPSILYDIDTPDDYQKYRPGIKE
jgi:molybdenum cofactor cytidylyltransferase